VRIFAVLLIGIIAAGGCSGRSERRPAKQENMPARDINEVLRDHDRELMSLPGVVGVYVGVMDDDKTPCLKVMAVKRTPELERAIPKSLEGYPVLIEETGAIKPMTNDE
jgi:hypothetical protein